MSAPEFLAFGREAASGAVAAVTRFYRVIPMGSEVCERCDAIHSFDDLLFVGSHDDEDGTPIYTCKGGCAP